MKAILFLIFCIFFCQHAKTQSNVIDSIITYQSMYETIATLADDSMQGRATLSQEADNTATYIAQRFEKAGLKKVSTMDGYFFKYPLRAGQNVFMAANVIGAIKGEVNQDSLVIFSAHYDHLGINAFAKKNSDSIYNGANDNASGIAGLIELAKYYTTIKHNKYTLLFIAFSGEELGLLGSKAFSQSINPKKMAAVINLDMIGRPINNNEHCMVISAWDRPILKKINSLNLGKEDFFISDRYPSENLNQRTDHYSFKNIQSCFSIMCSSPKDPYYHTVKDEIKTIDFDFLLRVTKKIAVACKVFIE